MPKKKSYKKLRKRNIIISSGIFLVLLIIPFFSLLQPKQITPHSASSVLGSTTVPSLPIVLYSANLTSSQEVPPTTSNANGKSFIFASPQTGQVTILLFIQNLSSRETAIYIHGPAAVGKWVLPIAVLPLGNPLRYTTTLTPQEMQYLQQGLLYINVYSENYPIGEIRGQYSLSPYTAIYAATLSGSHETPSNRSAAIGQSLMFVSQQTGQAMGLLTTENQSDQQTAASIQGPGAEGSTAPPIVALPTGDFILYSVTFTQEQLLDLQKGLLYVNSRSTNFPQGELRGQYDIVPFNSIFISNINASQETPPTASTAIGQSVIFFPPGKQEAILLLILGNLSSAETAAYIHGPTDINTPVVPLIKLPFINPLIYTTPLNDQEIAYLQSGLLYVSIYSDSYPNGEVRGKYTSLLSSMPSSQPTTATIQKPVSTPLHLSLWDRILIFFHIR